jgi:hypothetical protein
MPDNPIASPVPSHASPHLEQHKFIPDICQQSTDWPILLARPDMLTISRQWPDQTIATQFYGHQSPRPALLNFENKILKILKQTEL